MILEVEISLLEAVQEQIVAQLPFNDSSCQVELDDEVPAVAADKYIAVVAGGVGNGPRHKSSGGAVDLIFNVRCVVYERIADIPRDRKSKVYLDRLKGINKLVSELLTLVDYSYDIINSATTKLTGDAAGGKFMEPFRSMAIDSAPRSVDVTPYNAASMGNQGNRQFALRRGVTFQGARFMKVRT